VHLILLRRCSYLYFHDYLKVETLYFLLFIQNSNDQEHNEGEPLDPPFEQQPKSGVGPSMKLRSRKKSQKTGTHMDTDNNFGEDSVEPSLAEEDNDSGDDYTAGTTRKVRKKPRDSAEELLHQKVQKDKSQVSSRSRKRTSKDASVEKPKKKLNHRIRQSRAKGWWLKY
jgi:transcription factor TFIIIB component B''